MLSSITLIDSSILLKSAIKDLFFVVAFSDAITDKTICNIILFRNRYLSLILL